MENSLENMHTDVTVQRVTLMISKNFTTIIVPLPLLSKGTQQHLNLFQALLFFTACL